MNQPNPCGNPNCNICYTRTKRSWFETLFGPNSKAKEMFDMGDPKTIELTPGSSITVETSTGDTVTVTAPKGPSPITETLLDKATESQLIFKLQMKFGWFLTNPITGFTQLTKKK